MRTISDNEKCHGCGYSVVQTAEFCYSDCYVSISHGHTQGVVMKMYKISVSFEKNMGHRIEVFNLVAYEDQELYPQLTEFLSRRDYNRAGPLIFRYAMRFVDGAYFLPFLISEVASNAFDQGQNDLKQKLRDLLDLR